MCRWFLAAYRLVEDVRAIEDVVEPGSDVQVGHNEDVQDPGSAVRVIHRGNVQVVCKDALAELGSAVQEPGSAVQIVADGVAPERMASG